VNRMREGGTEMFGEYKFAICTHSRKKGCETSARIDWLSQEGKGKDHEKRRTVEKGGVEKSQESKR